MVENYIPQIRFKGFSGAWEISQLKFIAEINPKSDLPDEFIYVDLESVKGTELINSRLENKSSAPSRAQRLAQKNDIFYQTVRPYQKNNYLFDRTDTNYVFSTGYAQLRPICDSNFLINVFQREPFVQSVLDQCTGTSYPAINSNNLAEIEINVPRNPKEQKAIGSYFKNLDNQITLKQRNLDKLVTLKKAMLEKMFPKEGADEPEIRFKGFSGAWELKTLGDIVDLENGFAFKSKYFQKNESATIVLTPGNVHLGGGFQHGKGQFYDENYLSKIPSKFIFEPNDLFITMTDLTPTAQALGFPALVPSDGNTYLHNQRLGKLVNFDGDGSFLVNFLSTNNYQRKIISTASGTTVKHTSPSKVLGCEVYIPKLDEQQAIGSFFKKLDALISLQKTELTKLKQIKSSCLEKMFV